MISKIDPNSYIASLEFPQEYDRVIAVNRTKIDSMKTLKEAFMGVKRMAAEGEKFFSLRPAVARCILLLDKVLKTTKKRKRK